MRTHMFRPMLQLQLTRPGKLSREPRSREQTMVCRIVCTLCYDLFCHSHLPPLRVTAVTNLRMAWEAFCPNDVIIKHAPPRSVWMWLCQISVYVQFILHWHACFTHGNGRHHADIQRTTSCLVDWRSPWVTLLFVSLAVELVLAWRRPMTWRPTLSTA